MKKPYFHSAIYADSIKQIRLFGIVSLALCLIVTLLPILLAEGDIFLQVDDIAAILGTYMFIGPLLLTFSGFSFLFRRNASDFFHALPTTRRGLFTSMGAAVLTWVWGTILATLLIAYACMGIRGWTLDWMHLLYQFMGYGFGAMLVMGCCMIGISVTGRRFSAFIVSGLILFLPRFISVVCAALLQSTAPLLILSSSGFLLNVNLNFPVGYFLNMFGVGRLFGGATSDLFLNGATHIYTAVLALIYIALAGLAFHFRPSESAEKSAPSRILQHIYRSLITLPLLLALSTMIMASNGVEGTELTILIVAIFLVYFLYELITTKKFKNLLGALCVLPIVAVFSFVVSFATVTYGNTQMQILPQAAEIESAQWCMDVETTDYQMLRVSEVVIDDPALIEIISDGLSYSYDRYQRDMLYYAGRETTTYMAIHMKNGNSIQRKFRIRPEDDARYHALYEGSAAYIAAKNSLPEDNEVLRITMDGADVSEAQLQEIWQTYRAEVLALSESERALHEQIGEPASELYTGGTEPVLYEGQAAPWLHLYVSGSRHSKNFQYGAMFSIYTPQSASLAMRYCNQARQAKVEDVLHALDNEKNTEVSLSLDMQIVQLDVNGTPHASASMYFYGGYMGYGADVLYTEEELRDAIHRLLSFDTSNPVMGENLVQYRLHVNYMDADGKYRNLSTSTIFAPITEEQAQMLLGLVGVKKIEPEGVPEPKIV